MQVPIVFPLQLRGCFLCSNCSIHQRRHLYFCARCTAVAVTIVHGGSDRRVRSHGGDGARGGRVRGVGTHVNCGSGGGGALVQRTGETVLIIWTAGVVSDGGVFVDEVPPAGEATNEIRPQHADNDEEEEKEADEGNDERGDSDVGVRTAAGHARVLLITPDRDKTNLNNICYDTKISYQKMNFFYKCTRLFGHE